VPVEGFSPIWDALFPKGRLFPGDKRYLEPDIPQTLIRYLNFPGLRTRSVAYSLEKRISARLRTGIKPLAILNYNPFPYYCRALDKIAQQNPEISWVNMVLDLDDPARDNWNAFKHATRRASAAVFLSWWGFCNAPIKQKLHLDCGWEGDFPKVKNSDNNVFVYCGSMGNFGGIRDIVEAIRIFPHNNVRFDFFGKGFNEELKRLAATDRRVRFCGFIPDAELEQECQKATAFLCPRNLEYQGTKMIFPSKLLFYLKFQKPVICPHIPGLSPDYYNVLISPPSNKPEDWTATMREVLALSEEAKNALSTRIRSFLLTKKWDLQAAKLIAFLKELNELKEHSYTNIKPRNPIICSL